MSGKSKVSIKLKSPSQPSKPQNETETPKKIEKIKISLNQMAPKKIKISAKIKEPACRIDEIKTNRSTTIPTIKNLYDIQLPPFKMKANQKISLLQSHYLSIGRLIKITIEHYNSNNVTLPFQVHSNELALFCTEHNIFIPVASNDVILDDLTLRAWKYIVGIYEQLKQKDLLDEVIERLGSYTTFRINEFLEDYQDFIKNGENMTWKDLKDQVLEVLKTYS